MKFRKMTATLFAAVLIAMMGVMPALAADSGPVVLTAEIERATLSLTVSAVTGFGIVTRGDPAQATFTIDVEGEGSLYLTTDTLVNIVQVTDFYYGLLLNNELVDGLDQTVSPGTGISMTLDLLEVPDVPYDVYTGSFILWLNEL